MKTKPLASTLLAGAQLDPDDEIEKSEESDTELDEDSDPHHLFDEPTTEDEEDDEALEADGEDDLPPPEKGFEERIVEAVSEGASRPCEVATYLGVSNDKADRQRVYDRMHKLVRNCRLVYRNGLYGLPPNKKKPQSVKTSPIVPTPKPAIKLAPPEHAPSCSQAFDFAIGVLTTERDVLQGSVYALQAQLGELNDQLAQVDAAIQKLK